MLLSPLIAILAPILWLALHADADEESFSPLTNRPAFRAGYLLEIEQDGKLVSRRRILEQYQQYLQASSIRVKRRDFSANDGKEILVDFSKFHYDGQNGRDILMKGAPTDSVFGFHVEDSGHSASPQSAGDPWKSIELLDKMNSLDYVIYELPKELRDKMPKLDLDPFLGEKCLSSKRLKHIRGLSRLLNLIECRRSEFGQVNSDPNETIKFRAKELKTMYSIREDFVQKLDFTFTVQNTGQPARAAKMLPPKGMVIEFGSVRLTIKVLQFQVIDPDEHLTDVHGSESIFLLPLMRSVDNLLLDEPDRTTPKSKQWNQYSFRASVSSSLLDLADPIELQVAYDVLSKRLASQQRYTDRNHMVAGEWRRLTRLSIFDGESMLRWSRMGADQYDEIDDAASANECLAEELASNELSALEAGSSEGFSTEDAVYMGMAMVRGVACHVYERRLARMPLWLGADIEAGFSGSSELHATIYLSAGRQLSGDRSNGRLLRLTISSQNIDPSISLRTLNIEVHSFSGDLDEGAMLFDSIRECLMASAEARYLELEFSLRPPNLSNVQDVELLAKLRTNKQLRDRTLARSLVSTFDITHSQQLDLDTDFTHDGELKLRVSVYKLPWFRVHLKIVRWALKFSTKIDPSVVYKSLSFHECQLLAAHHMKLSEGETSRTMLHCPSSFHCVVDDLDNKWDKIFAQSSGQSDVKGQCNLWKVELNEPLIVSSEPQVGGVPLELLVLRRNRVQDTPLVVRSEPGEPEAEFEFMATQLEVSRLKQPLEPNGNLLQAIEAIGYQLPDNDKRVLVVTDFAQCNHLCLSYHECRSFSVCSHHYGLRCILSRVNWTNVDEVAYMEGLSKATIHEQVAGQSKDSTLRKTITLDQSTQVEIDFVRSELCTIFMRNDLDLFIPKSAKNNELKVESSLKVASRAECARLCLGRAHQVRPLAIVPEKDTNKPDGIPEPPPQMGLKQTCTGFDYSAKKQACQLRPTLKFSDSLWLKFSRPNDWIAFTEDDSRDSLKNPGDLESFHLDHGLVFTATPNSRLDTTKYQRVSQHTILEASMDNCAKTCIEWPTCNSFDFRTLSKRKDSLEIETSYKGTCVMHTLGIVADAHLDDDLKEKQDSHNQTIWIHSEMNDVGRYLTGKLNLSEFNIGPDDVYLSLDRLTPKTSRDPVEASSQQVSRSHAPFWIIGIVFLAISIAIYDRGYSCRAATGRLLYQIRMMKLN